MNITAQSNQMQFVDIKWNQSIPTFSLMLFIALLSLFKQDCAYKIYVKVVNRSGNDVR